MSNEAKLKVITGKIRMNYANLFEPRAAKEGEESRFSLCVLIPKSDKETVRKINEAVEEAKKMGIRLWGGSLHEDLKMPLRDGDTDKPGQIEYEGHYYINAFSKQRPGIIDRNRDDILDKAQVYSGCYGRAALNFFAFSKPGNKGIGCKLLNVQKLADGEPLGRSSAQEDFAEDYDEEDILG